MSLRPVHLLGMSGSLRGASTNSRLLRAAVAAAPDRVELQVFKGIADLPIFNPDLERDPWPPAVMALRAAVAAADGLVIACPEYAHGIPGGLKNALDWLVSGAEAPHKPVALFHASARSFHGREALSEVLRTMSMRVLPDFSFTVHLLGLDAAACDAALAEPRVRASLNATLAGYAASLRGR